MDRPAEWYDRELAKVLAILQQEDVSVLIGRDYIQEKLAKIAKGAGIVIHPTLEPHVERIYQLIREQKK